MTETVEVASGAAGDAKFQSDHLPEYQHAVFLQAGCPSYGSTASVTALKAKMIDDSSLQARTHSQSQLAWSEGRRPLGAVLHSSDEPSELSQ